MLSLSSLHNKHSKRKTSIQIVSPEVSTWRRAGELPLPLLTALAFVLVGLADMNLGQRSRLKLMRRLSRTILPRAISLMEAPQHVVEGNPPPRSVASPSLSTKPLGHQHLLQEALRHDVSNDPNRLKPRSSSTGQNKRYILTLSVLSSFLMRKKLILMDTMRNTSLT
jgi:hypothetical protein